MRTWIGRQFLILGLRILGFAPTQAVVFASEFWGPREAARWGGAALRSTPAYAGPLGGRLTVICRDFEAFDQAYHAETKPCPSCTTAPGRS